MKSGKFSHMCFRIRPSEAFQEDGQVVRRTDFFFQEICLWVPLAGLQEFCGQDSGLTPCSQICPVQASGSARLKTLPPPACQICPMWAWNSAPGIACRRSKRSSRLRLCSSSCVAPFVMQLGSCRSAPISVSAFCKICPNQCFRSAHINARSEGPSRRSAAFRARIRPVVPTHS